MRDSTTIFDREADARADADADLTQEFWGDRAGWAPTGRQRVFQLPASDDRTDAFRLDHTPASMAAIRDGIAAFRPKRRRRDDATGPIERTREHGVVRAGPVPGGETSPRAAATSAGVRRRPSPDRLAHRDATIADLAAGRYDDAPYPRSIDDDPAPVDGARRGGSHGARELDEGTDDDLIALTPATPPPGLLGSVDPMVVRIALVAIAVVLLIPLALALRDDASGTDDPDPIPAVVEPAVGSAEPSTGAEATGAGGASGSDTGLAPDGTPAAPDGDPAEDPSATADQEPATESAPSDASPAATPTDAVVQSTASSSGEVQAEAEPAATSEAPASADTAASPAAAAATVTEEAEREIPDCSRTYMAGAGDSWYRIADEAGVTPAVLLEQNRATLDTVIFPDAEICLPAGAAMPSPPTTVATTVAPATTASPATTTAPTATDAPAGTDAPTTTAPTTTAAPAPAPQPSYTVAEVQALIRETWPADEVDKALDVAWRESNYQATADNGWCCVGVFQLYWTVHQDWLDDYGINTRDDLKDARKNIAAAYALYQSSGGWGPWGG